MWLILKTEKLRFDRLGRVRECKTCTAFWGGEKTLKTRPGGRHKNCRIVNQSGRVFAEAKKQTRRTGNA